MYSFRMDRRSSGSTVRMVVYPRRRSVSTVGWPPCRPVDTAAFPIVVVDQGRRRRRRSVSRRLLRMDAVSPGRYNRISDRCRRPGTTASAAVGVKAVGADGRHFARSIREPSRSLSSIGWRAIRQISCKRLRGRFESCLAVNLQRRKSLESGRVDLEVGIFGT